MPSSADCPVIWSGLATVGLAASRPHSITGKTRVAFDHRVTPPWKNGEMKTAEVHSLVERVAAVASDCSDWGVLKAGVEDVRRLKSWVEGREVVLAQLAAKVSSFPEKSLAEAGRTSLRNGERLLGRAETAGAVPALGESLDAGRVSGEHVDVLTRALRGVEPAVRDKLIDQGDRLAKIAETTAPDEFARSVRDEA